MSLARSPRPTLAVLAGLTGVLLLLAGCAYQDGYYYESSPGYGYDYGYGGYGYGYGGYGYGYGAPCWPYGCGGWNHHRHRRHHNWDDDNDGDGGRHHHGDSTRGGRPPVDPNRQAGDFPRRHDLQNPRQAEPAAPARTRPQGSPKPYYYVPQQRDSKN